MPVRSGCIITQYLEIRCRLLGDWSSGCLVQTLNILDICISLCLSIHHITVHHDVPFSITANARRHISQRLLSMSLHERTHQTFLIFSPVLFYSLVRLS